MDNKEAINKLIQFRRILEKGVFPVGYRFHAEPFDMAISALEKQEAIKSCTPPSDDWEQYADRLHDIAYQSGYEQRKQEKDRWISVTEWLPEDEYVLISKRPTKLSGSKWCVGIGIRIADPRSGKIQWRDSGFGVIQDDQVLAWMPLPEQYHEEDKA